MNRFQKILATVLIPVLVLSAFSACGSREIPAATENAPTQIQETSETQAPPEPTVSDGYYRVGDRIEDFTVTTYDGREINLYKVLEEKDMVLLNFWATWCGPCGMEFPAMQEAYEQYQDKMEIIAMSIEDTDSDEVLADYVQEKGMTFCVARDAIGLNSRFQFNGIPTSIVVDRFGTICLLEEGAMPDSAVFTNLFDVYTAEDYPQSVFIPSMLSEQPTVQPADPAQLNEALNGDGGTLVFTNASNPYYWPMTVEQKDGRTVVTASNAASPLSKAVVETQVDVNAGDVLVMEYKLASENYTNVMSVEVDGKVVKKIFAAEDWKTYAYRFEEGGSHKVSIGFKIDREVLGADEGMWIDSIRVVTGDEALQALEANPQYPVGEQNNIKLLNENVTEAYIYDEADPSVTEPMYFCPDSTLRLMITLDETLNPENTWLENVITGDVYPLVLYAVEDGYLVEIPNATEETYLSCVFVYSDDDPVMGMNISLSEEACTQYFDMIREYTGQSLVWEYCDDSMAAQTASGDVTYTVTYVDQNGDPVPGVMCQVCDETMCQVFISDANGICQFTLPAKSYEIHTLKLPDGYDGDTVTVSNAPMQGGELTFTLTKK